MDEILKNLQKPFPENELEFRVGATNLDKTKGLALAYIQARAIQNRLDEVIGIENWKISYKEITGGFIAKLELKINNEWIAKEDGAGTTDY
ncbi:MAG: Rad52/Rad22 family DNA repair protein, partial [Cetobacterium sp.]